MYQTNQYEGMIAETVAMQGHKGETINAYIARPLGSGPFPGMVVDPPCPGWDEWYRECTRKFAHHGYVAISPNLYFRDGHGTPEDVGAKVRAGGGIPDEQVLGDLDGANKLLRSLPYVSAKVGVFGTCSGGRHGFLAACRLEKLRRAGRVLGRPRGAVQRRANAETAGRAHRLHQRSSLSDDRSYSATTTNRRRRNRSISTKRSSRSTAKIMNSIATTAPAMAFSITIARPIGRNRPSTAGKSCSPSARRILKQS